MAAQAVHQILAQPVSALDDCWIIQDGRADSDDRDLLGGAQSEPHSGRGPQGGGLLWSGRVGLQLAASLLVDLVSGLEPLERRILLGERRCDGGHRRWCVVHGVSGVGMHYTGALSNSAPLSD